MQYRIRNILIPVPEDHRLPLLATLALYDKGVDTSNSPLIQSRVNLTHADVYQAKDKEEALQKRQQTLFKLYEKMKLEGYNGSKILVWFDDDGFIRLYDGYHRLTIMEHLKLDQKVIAETEWEGINKTFGFDFPLAEVLRSEPPKGEWLYQPVNDKRLSLFQVDRKDSPQRLEYILKNLSGKTILDIGCSEGYFSREFAKKKYKVTAIDDRPNLVAVARYLTTINNLKVDYHVADWRGFLKDHYENILFLSVIHNNMKTDGIESCLKPLELFKDRADRVFFEVPNSTGEKEWMREGFPKFDFHKNLPMLEDLMGMKVVGQYDGLRTIYLFEKSKKQWWSLEEYLLPERTHYRPLYATLRTHPCRNIMEIGTHNGNNAVVMIKAAAQRVPEEEIYYYGFDLFEEKTDPIRQQEFSPIPVAKERDVKAHIRKHTRAKISLIKGNTRLTLREATKTLPKMDLIYIDGGHQIETTRSDWKHAQKLMHENTVVYFDDYDDEMPFIGPKFIVDELSPKYIAQVMPEVDYYRRPFGRLKSQLLRVTQKNVTVKKGAPPHYRFHLLAPAHSQMTREWFICAFTQLAYGMCRMLMDMGHEVYLYAPEGSNAPCTEYIEVLSNAEQKKAYGDWSPYSQLWIHKGSDPAYTAFRANAITEINERKRPHDILLITLGNWQQEVASKTGVLPIEYAVGHLGYFSKYKVFPSYAWMHHLMGKELAGKPDENFGTGNWYDAVIPHYFDPDEFTFSDKKGDYFLYVGRLINRKGPHVATDICKHLGTKLKVSGQPLYPDKLDQCLRDLNLDQPHVEYLGAVDMEERNRLMAAARAVIVPSLYFEPFGLVVVESMLCGTPVLTTDWGSFPEIVKHGEVGYRCRTMDDFIWAANNVHKLDPAAIREYAVKNYSMERISKMYREYFMKVIDLYGEGWYTKHQDRKELDWLRRY